MRSPSRPAWPVVAVALVVAAAVGGAGLAAQGLLAGPGAAPAPAPSAGPGHGEHGAGAPTTVVAAAEEVVVGGTRVALALQPGTGALRLTFTEAEGGAAVDTPARPLVWADRRRESETAGTAGTPTRCEDKIRAFAQGRLGSSPDVDLNHYDILTLNDDPSISVIDPHADVAGMTQLSAMATLEAPGDDWVLSRDGRRLFVSMPAADAVAVVDTADFEVLASIGTGPAPTALSLDPAGERLWVTSDPGPGAPGGVSVIDPGELTLLGSVATGPSPGRVAFAGPDGGTALVGHDDGTLAVIDPEGVRVSREVVLDGPVTDLAATPDRVYAALGGDRPVAVLDPGTYRVVGTLEGTAEVTRLVLEPGGRRVHALSGPRGTLAVADAASGRVLASGAVGSQPADVSFTDAHAYVRSADSTEVAVLELSRLERPGPLDVVRVDVGQNPPRPTDASAAALAPVHGTEILVAQPSDQYVYLYMPGMNAPMGGFGTYGRTPRAVTVLDHGLREEDPGVWTGELTLPAPGSYDLAVALEEPRVLHCFTVVAEADVAPAAGPAEPVRAELAGAPGSVTAGEPVSLRFRLVDADDADVSGLTDAQVLATLPSGQGQARAVAVPAADGTYAAELVLPSEGRYDVRVAVPSRGVGIGDLPALAVDASAP